MRLNSLKSTFDEYKGWGVLALVIYVIYCFRGVFTTLGDTANAAAEAALAKAKADALAAANQQKVSSSGGAKRKVTAQESNTFAADANTVAHMLGYDSFGLATVFKDRAGAFSLLKRSYSRLNLWNNKPFIKSVVGGKTKLTNVSTETPQCVKNDINWKVLVPFYKEATNGRDLLADLRGCLDIPEFRPWIKWII